ncbi:MAG: superoxide dismutase [Gemmatimonadota bacterium]|nr:superoxide dismutase [Gemmatimonadota bacterium]
MAYPFQLPELGYDYDALEPHIDARTMEIHHSKHHAGYTNNLNKALEGHESLQRHSAEQLLWNFESLPEGLKTAVRNNGGGYVNHKLFWNVIAPGGPAGPDGLLEEKLEAAFGSVDGFKEKLTAAAATRFGSGWGWLAVNSFGELEVFSTANQDSPLMRGHVPVLGVDVWEHAYYLKYQNRRADYLQAFWSAVNWDHVGDNLARAVGGAAPVFKALEDFGREIRSWAEKL